MLSGLANDLSAQQAQTSGPKIWLQDNQSLGVRHVGAAAATVGASQPVAMASGDINGDGVADLVVGHRSANSDTGFVSIYRGNLDAFAPQSDASFQAIGRGEFPSPFLPDAQTFSVPVTPDFLALGNFTGDGQRDLLIAARGSNTLYVFPGDGKGGFGAAQTIGVPGGVTSLAAGEFGPSAQYSTVLIGVNGVGKSFSLIAMGGSPQGLNMTGAIPLKAAASNFDFGNFGLGNDAAFLSGGQIFILRSSSLKIVPVSLPVTVQAFAVGSFLFDRNAGAQIAILTADGSVHIAARSEFDPRTFTNEEFQTIRAARLRNEAPALIPASSFPANGWKIVESLPSVAAVAAGQQPVFLRTRISSNGGDDIMWLNAGNSQMALISHPDVTPGAQTFAPGQVSIKPYNGSALQALPTRINIDGRPGIVAIHQGTAVPSLSMPIPDPTFFVNRTDDPAPGSIATTCNNVSNADTSTSCSVREAVRKANATAGTDTIQIAAGTYTLSIAKVANDCTSIGGALYINDSVNVVGAGQATTIIQAGSTNANGVDMVMAVNEDLGTAACPITNATASISNLTLKFGRNTGTHGNDGDGGCMEFDTGSSGNANLTLTNVTLTDCSTTKGNGAGIAIFNFTAPANGLATFSNSIVQNNSAVDTTAGVGAGGGGIWVSQPSRASISNTQILNNKATQVNGTGKGIGGGIFTFSNVPNSRQTVIHNSTISGNKSAGFGGGIWNSVNLLVDQDTLISNNTAGTDGTNPVAGQHGGGLYDNTSSNGCPGACTDVATLNKVTITGNTATGSGGGIYHGNLTGSGSLTVSLSRLAGNSATVSASNLFEDHSVATVTNNWWGTNAVATTIVNSSGTTTFDPFIVLTHSASGGGPRPAVIRINQSATLTGDMSKDNHGSGAALTGNLDEIVGLPITFDNPVLGSIPQAQPETLGNPIPTATATFNAGGTSGRGSADATVDEGTVGANSNLIASATEAGTTVTITTVGVHNFAANETVVISGVGVSGYNGTFNILSTPTATTFTYTAGTAGLGASTGGTANVGIIILEPPQITKSFGAATVPINGTTTVNFSINNPNVAVINTSFTDTLPTGLQVAATPGVTNTCGGTVTAVAGSGTISFSNNLTPIGVCTISVNITGTVDNQYTNSVSILSTDAGNGNTSSANITVINPPHIVKAFGALTIPLNGTTSLTFTIDSNGNQNLTQTGVAFTDNLPLGLVVATPGNPSTTCSGGTVTAANGSSTVSLAGASIAPVSSCTVSVTVQGTTAGVKNNSVQVTSTNAGNGNTANATITVVAPPTISKAFGAASIPLNGTTSVTFTINNPNATVDLSGVAFSDTLPNTTGTLVVATPNGVANTCGGTVTATAGTGVISLSGASVTKNTSCTLSVNVTGTAAGDALNTTGAITSTEGGTGATSNTATIKIVAPPTISKAFGAAAIPLNGTTTVTFTITNPAVNTTSETGIAFSDTLTNGLQVASTPGVSNTCGGTVTAAANSTSISLTGGSIATPGATCTIVVNVTGTQSGTVSNTTGAVSSTNGGTGATSNTATLIVAAPATVTKVFGATKIPLNGTTSLTITITNPNTNVSLTGLAFTDNLPAGLVVATPSGLTNTCGGTATATAGSSSVSLSGGTVAASASCTVSVNVQGTTAGTKNNSVTVSSTEGGASTPATATITVVAPPTIAKAFGAASIPLNGTTTATFTISNPNNPATPANGDLTGVAFSDTLPVSGGPGSATLVVSSTPNVTNTCGGTVTATAGTGVISLTGGSVAHNSSCTISVDVKGTVEGDASNTTGAISSTEGGTGATSNTATIKVVAPPSIAKLFNPSTIALNATTSLQFTITNPVSNTTALTGVAFTDTLPTGLTVANATSTVCGGTLTTTAPTGIALSGATIAVGGQCQFNVTVTGAASGQYTNTTGAVTSTNGGTGNTASANLTVASAATVTKQFGALKIPLNGTTSLTINITNPNTNVSLTGLSFTDSLPAGLVVATPNNLNNTCGGTATATAGSGAVSLSGGTLAASASCTVSVNVQGTTAGDKINSVVVSSTEGGASPAASATVTVVAPPTIAKAFGAASIPLNGTTSVTFTIGNPNNPATPANGDLTGVAFSDTLPVSSGVGSATLVVAATPNVSNTCGGTVTATAGTGVISLTGGSVAHNATCTITVDVTGTVAGDAANTTGAISSTEGGTGATSNTATIKVVAPPSIAKLFNPSTIALNATTSLQFTITNPAANTTALTGVAFTDTLPTGLTVANATSTVCGGTLTTTAPTGIALSGATIAAGGQCVFNVTVTGAVAGQYTNTTGNVTSTNGGTGNTATANLTVGTPPTITKAFGAASILLNASTSLTFNISNPNTNLALSGVTFSDTLPAGLVVATPNGLSSSCGGTTTATAGSGSISLSGGTLAANGSCTISLNVTGVQAGVQNNTTGAISSNETGAGATSNTASITVIGPPSIAKQFGAASINLNAQTTLSFTITNPNATVALTGVGFGDTLPAGLTIATPNGLTGSCGSGTITTGTVSGFSVVNLSGGTIAAGGSCTFSVNVVGTTGGHKVNTTGTVTSSNAGSGNQATATIDVNAPDLAITKTHQGTFTRGQTGAQWTITVSNVGFGPTVGTVTVTDTLPNVQNPPVATAISGTGWTCTLATLTCTRSDALSSGSYPPITLTVNIPINIVNNFTNTATVSGGGDVNPNNNTATDSISLGPPIVITPHANVTQGSAKAGSAAQFVFDVEDDNPALGMVAFGCSGLPVGTSCTFNPPATNQAISQVTMTVNTSGNGNNAVSSGQLFGPGSTPPFYALLVPVLGLLGIAATGRKKKTRLRLALVFAGIMTLLTFAGCGGVHGITTPAGNYTITVSATTTTVQATTQITLTVQ
jgi:fimbrial isopeptide formation D2 family protein